MSPLFVLGTGTFHIKIQIGAPFENEINLATWLGLLWTSSDLLKQALVCHSVSITDTDFCLRLLYHHLLS